MFVTKMAFMTCIDDPIHYRATSYLPNQKAEEFYKRLDHLTRFYNSARHTIKMIHIDREFKPIINEVEDEMDLKMNYANKGEHIPKAERNNQTLKDQIQIKYHLLSYKNIPKVVIKELVFDVAEKLNYFQPRMEYPSITHQE